MSRTPKDMLAEAEQLYCEGEYDAGLMVAAAALAVLDADDDRTPVRAKAYYLVGQGHHHLERLEGAAGFTDKAIAAFEQQPSPDVGSFGDALHSRAVIHLQRGELGEALPLLSRAAGLLENAADQRMAFAAVLLTMAEIAHGGGEPDDAVGLLRRVLDVLADLEAKSEQEAAMINALWAKGFFSLGSIAARKGDVAEATDLLSRSVEFFDAAFGHGHPAMIAALQDIAAIFRAIGHDDQAAAIEEELAVAERMLKEAEASALDLN